MPKLNQEQLKDVRYLSLVDFNNKIDQYENPSDKVKFATQYLLTYGLSADPDYKLAEAIHFVRVKLSESVDDKNMDLSTKVFLADPVKYLKSHAIIEAAKHDKNNNLIDDEAMISEHYHQLEEKLNGVLAHQIRDLDNNMTAFDVKVRMSNKLGSKNAVDKLYKETKPGFFSRLFNTSSLQAKNLDKAFKEFNDPTVNAYGNINMLDEAARAYLSHKLGWMDGDPLPDASALEKLDKTAKARCLLSIKAIEAGREQRQLEEKFTGMDEESVKNVKPEEYLGFAEETKGKEESIISEAKEEIKVQEVSKPKEKTIMDELKEADEANALKDEGEIDFDEMEKLNDLDQSEEYAVENDYGVMPDPEDIDEYENDDERIIVEVARDLDREDKDTQEIAYEKALADAEAERLKNYKYDIEFQGYLEEDSKIDIDVFNEYIPQAPKEESYNTSGLNSADFTENQIEQSENEEEKQNEV